MAYEKLQQRLLDFLEEKEGRASNRAALAALGCAEATYDRIKEALEQDGKVKRGPGQGGTVHLTRGGKSRKSATSALPRSSPPTAPPQSRSPWAPIGARHSNGKMSSGHPVNAYLHGEEARKNIPTAELQSIAQQMEESAPFPPARYPRAAPLPRGETRPRNADLDPQIVWRGMRIRLTEAQRAQLVDTGEVELGDAQLVWRGKDTQDWSDLVVNPPPIYIQEKIHPKVIIEGLRKEARARAEAATDAPDLFADFNGLDDPEARLEFYQHDQHWSNRMILGDSLQVMASLAEREELRGKVQCIYFDPPYGIKFNSNWQVSTQNPKIEDGKRENVSREPEQVKAFRDTWKDGIDSYLTYLRDRLTVARELLTESGSIFLQIGDENVHRVRAVMDEVVGSDNHLATISFFKTSGQTKTNFVPTISDHIVIYAKRRGDAKYRQLFLEKILGGDGSKEHNLIQLSDGSTRTKSITRMN